MIEIRIEKKIRSAEEKTLRLNLALARTDILHLIGPSGSGKTTLLKLIAGFLKPDSGIVRVNSVTWFDSDREINLPVYHRKPGFVFQDYALFPHMSIQQHLEFSGPDQHLRSELLQLAGLESIRHRKPRALSGGQRQRLALIRAMSARPTLLLMDEPFYALDEKLKKPLISELRGYVESWGMTCIIASHNQQEMATLKTKEINLEDFLIDPNTDLPG